MSRSRRRPPGRGGKRLVAVLGPTNTGKTYLAIERMVGHRSGMIGFPLRLLARENYDRVKDIKGADAVALVTGEEKIIPPRAKYFLCTVESMPLDRDVAFLAIDEIQLCADRDRGHVFTDRLLHARGAEETMFLGADTMRLLIGALVPDVEFITRPRFSRLSYSGPKKITRLPPRSAVVAFSAAEVYDIADLVRRQRGGAAVVLGALSPRARNAQVAMYQAGEVDHLVATDAIGMGLNMDVNHVAFAGLRKFDGRNLRLLTPFELAQIAGRAGRYMNDGTFGTTFEVGGLDAETVETVETHAFPPLETVYWRNSDLAFNTIRALVRGLEAPPPAPELVPKRDAEDVAALTKLARDPDIAGRAGTPQAVRLLWDVCRIPDYRKELSESHLRLLGRIYADLTGPGQCLDEDWVAAQIARLDRADGDIETLVSRIDYIRTWTYVSHRADWFADAGHWQERTRAIEDKLSDALHERLTQRFVDRRTAVLVKRLKDGDGLLSAVKPSGEVLVEGHFVGTLEGFQFVPDTTETGIGARTIMGAAARALRQEVATRVERLCGDSIEAFTLDDCGRLRWRGIYVARLAMGTRVLRPRLIVAASDLLTDAQAGVIRRRLEAWLGKEIKTRLGPLVRVDRACGSERLAAPVRGLLYQLAEGLGTLPRRRAVVRIPKLGATERRALARFGVRLGVETVFVNDLLDPQAVRMRGLLWSVHHGPGKDIAIGNVPGKDGPAWLPAPALTSAPRDTALDDSFYLACGYLPLGPRVLRVDQAERLAAELRKLSRQGPFMATHALARLAACSMEELSPVLAALGFEAADDGTHRAAGFGRNSAPRPRRAKPRRKAAGAKQGQSGESDSPFAKLRELNLPR
ncbi:MAG: helicase-related protein [Alphaproteobacteria bacterium]